MIAAEWVPVKSIDEITEEHLISCVEAQAVYKPSNYEAERIDDIVSDIKMDTSVKDSSSRVWTFYKRYLTRFENHGMGDLPDEKPHVVIKQLLNKVEPEELRLRMKAIAFWKKDRDFDKRNVNAFLRELVNQTERYDDMKLFGKRRRASPFQDSDDSDDESNAKKNSARKKRRKGKFSRGRKSDAKDSGAAKKKTEQKKLPNCLNPKCNGKHYLRDCPITSEEEGRKIYAEFRRNRNLNNDNTKEKGVINKVSRKFSENHSALFSGSFANGAVEVEILADQGSDVNLISNSVFQDLIRAESNLKTESIAPPAKFGSINQSDAVICSTRVVADVQLRIRHGTNLLLRNVEWHVSDSELAHVIIGRTVLEAIGCDNRALLAAASDNSGGVVDAKKAIDERAREKRGTINAVLDTDSPSDLFHSHGGTEDDKIPEEKIYMELGENTPEELNEKLEESIQRAAANGLSRNGVKDLREIINRYRSVFE